MATLNEKLHVTKMKFVAETVKEAIKDSRGIARAVSLAVGCSGSTANRLINQCQDEGYLKGVEILPGRSQPNKPLQITAEELGIDADVLRAAIMKAGGRVNVGTPAAALKKRRQNGTQGKTDA